MAWLELSCIEIFDAADVPPITSRVLAAIPESPWEQTRVVIHPALRLLQVDCPVATLRRQLIEARASAKNVPLPAREAHCLLLFRRDLQMFHERLSRGAFALLQALTRRVPLLSACQQAQLEVPGEAAEIAESVGPWFQS